MTDTAAHGASFRDPAGHMFTYKDTLYRQVNEVGSDDYEQLMNSGLYARLVSEGKLVPHTVVNLRGVAKDAKRYKVLQPELVPFVSYPYEWTFAQLQAAAVLTLSIMKTALEHKMILKDASAYNIQFIGSRPVLIDTLSFTRYEEGDQWEGYKQFCEHFVAPLALGAYVSPRIMSAQRNYLDGVPLALATAILPHRARLRPGLLAHLFVHGSSQRRYQEGGQAKAAQAKQRRMTPLAMQGLLGSLDKTVKSLKPKRLKTEWGDYYTFTNYSDDAFKAKRRVVSDLLSRVTPKPKIVWDIGANNGEFSELAAEKGAYTVAFDIDEVAVERNFKARRPDKVQSQMLALVQDLTNPSPAIGWAHEERSSLVERGPADVVMALALIHHLAIGNNVPFNSVAHFLRLIGKHVIIEFVPKGDSKVDHLLASRKDIFDEYDAGHFESAMSKHFELIEKKSVKGSLRSIYLYKAK